MSEFQEGRMVSMLHRPGSMYSCIYWAPKVNNKIFKKKINF